jgi:hypothetical protein
MTGKTTIKETDFPLYSQCIDPVTGKTTIKETGFPLHP